MVDLIQAAFSIGNYFWHVLLMLWQTKRVLAPKQSWEHIWMNSLEVNLLKYTLCFHFCSADMQPLEGTVGSPQQESTMPSAPPPLDFSFCFPLSFRDQILGH